MTTRQRVPKAARLRPGPVDDVTAATKLAMRHLARRWLALEEEIKQLDANCALHMIAINRLSHDPRSRAYVNARTTDGKADPDILRRLKRYIAREVYKLLIDAFNSPAPAT
jgi:hypothetical protein